MRPIGAIMFDLDDTLLYFDEYWEVSMKKAFASFPLTRPIDLALLFPVFLEKDEKFHIEWLEGRIGGEEFRRLRFVETLAALGIEAGAEEAESFERWFRSVRAPHIPYDTELIARLTRMAEAYPLAIVTNGTEEDQFDKLNRMGLDRLFTKDNVFVSDRLGAAKPQPDAYRIPAARLGVAPEAVLFVGDSWANDVAGPMQAGMQAVWLNRRELPQPPGPKPLAVVTALAELEALILGTRGE